jgi:hypothetical protein
MARTALSVSPAAYSGWGAFEHGQAVPVGQVLERFQGSRKVLPQRVAELVGVARARAQIMFWCPRATTLTASASAVSAAIGR